MKRTGIKNAMTPQQSYKEQGDRALLSRPLNKLRIKTNSFNSSKSIQCHLIQTKMSVAQLNYTGLIRQVKVSIAS